MQYNKVEICGVNTMKLKVLKEDEKIIKNNARGKWKWTSKNESRAHKRKLKTRVKLNTVFHEQMRKLGWSFSIWLYKTDKSY